MPFLVLVKTSDTLDRRVVTFGRSGREYYVFWVRANQICDILRTFLSTESSKLFSWYMPFEHLQQLSRTPNHRHEYGCAGFQTDPSGKGAWHLELEDQPELLPLTNVMRYNNFTSQNRTCMSR
jgi:hypothetical protein